MAGVSQEAASLALRGWGDPPSTTGHGRAGWSPGGFTLSSRKELTAEARELKGELYCLPCHDKMGVPICGACRRPVEGRVVNALGKQWHVEVSEASPDSRRAPRLPSPASLAPKPLHTPSSPQATWPAPSGDLPRGCYPSSPLVWDRSVHGTQET